MIFFNLLVLNIFKNIYLDPQQAQSDVQPVRLLLGLHEHHRAVPERTTHERR